MDNNQWRRRQGQRPQHQPANRQFQRGPPPPVHQQPGYQQGHQNEQFQMGAYGNPQGYYPQPEPGGIQGYQGNPVPFQGPQPGYWNPQGYYPDQAPEGIQGYQGNPLPFQGPQQGFGNPQGHPPQQAPEGVQGYQGNPLPFQGPQPGYRNPQGYPPQQAPGGIQGYQGNPFPQQPFMQPPFQGPEPGYWNPHGYPPQQVAPQPEPFTLLEIQQMLDRIFDPDWGTKAQRNTIVREFDSWRREHLDWGPWLEQSILLMEKDTFQFTLVDEQMCGVYRFIAYVRMHNFLFLADHVKTLCMEFGYVPGPLVPEVTDMQWFREPRSNHPSVVVTEALARRYLDQKAVRAPDANQQLRDFRGQREDWYDVRYWVDVNICGAFPRVQNFNNLHESWHEEFLNVAHIPFKRTAVIFDPTRPETIDCFRDAPSSNPNLERTEQRVNQYLNHKPSLQLSKKKVDYLFGVWKLNHPKYYQLLRDRVEKGNNQDTRRLNWLLMDARWKGTIIAQIWKFRRNRTDQ